MYEREYYTGMCIDRTIIASGDTHCTTGFAGETPTIPVRDILVFSNHFNNLLERVA